MTDSTTRESVRAGKKTKTKKENTKYVPKSARRIADKYSFIA